MTEDKQEVKLINPCVGCFRQPCEVMKDCIGYKQYQADSLVVSQLQTQHQKELREILKERDDLFKQLANSLSEEDASKYTTRIEELKAELAKKEQEHQEQIGEIFADMKSLICDLYYRWL